MGYSIIFQTKIVKLSDGRILHLDRSGCNNDTEGRRPDDWTGKIYTPEAFIAYAENFKQGSKPAKESDGFDLKIGSRYCTCYDYGEHLLRMLKRAVTWDEFMCSGKAISFKKMNGAIVSAPGMIGVEMTQEQFEDFAQKNMEKISFRYIPWYMPLSSENEVVEALEQGERVRIYIK